MKGKRKGCSSFFQPLFSIRCPSVSYDTAYKTVMEIYSGMIEFTTLAGYDDNFITYGYIGLFSHSSKREQSDFEEIKKCDERNVQHIKFSPNKLTINFLVSKLWEKVLKICIGKWLIRLENALTCRIPVVFMLQG